MRSQVNKNSQSNVKILVLCVPTSCERSQLNSNHFCCEYASTSQLGSRSISFRNQFWTETNFTPKAIQFRSHFRSDANYILRSILVPISISLCPNLKSCINLNKCVLHTFLTYLIFIKIVLVNKSIIYTYIQLLKQFTNMS